MLTVSGTCGALAIGRIRVNSTNTGASLAPSFFRCAVGFTNVECICILAPVPLFGGKTVPLFAQKEKGHGGKVREARRISSGGTGVKEKANEWVRLTARRN